MDRPWWAWGCHEELTPRDLHNHGRLNLAGLAWILTFADSGQASGVIRRCRGRT